MSLKKIKFVIIIFLLYQTPIYSKSNSFKDINFNNLSKYFSGIIALENKDNSAALNFFNSSKVLINNHDLFLKKYVYSLVLEDKVLQAINVVKNNKYKNNSNFFDAYLLLIIDCLKKNDFEKANFYLQKASSISELDGFKIAILESLKQYFYVFEKKKILNNKKNLGKLSIISETFQK